MSSFIHLVHGEDLEENRKYILTYTENEKSLVLLSELTNYQTYVGFNRNIQTGLTTEKLKEKILQDYKYIIVEPYDYEDFKSFLNLSDVLHKFLRKNNKKMFILVEKKLNLKNISNRLKRNVNIEERFQKGKIENDIVLSLN